MNAVIAAFMDGFACGSITTADSSVDYDNAVRIGKTMKQLANAVWRRCYISGRTKTKTSNALVMPILLWSLTPGT